MMEYVQRYPAKLLVPLLQHVELVVVALVLSLIIAAFLMLVAVYVPRAKAVLMQVLGVLYSVPSIALLVLLIPLTGLGTTTALVALVFYNQFLLLRSTLAGFAEVDPGIVEAGLGMGMTTWQLLLRVKVPLARASIVTGIRLAAVSTIGIATLAALVNAGGLGVLLFDGLRTMNMAKILWGSLLAAVLAVAIDAFLRQVEHHWSRAYGAETPRMRQK